MSFQIWNRRYTGSKYKLSQWIFELIQTHCQGQSFCDLFAGTGIIAAKASEYYSKIIINDLLYSNEIIYRAFFTKHNISNTTIKNYFYNFNKLNANELPDNYFSKNFANKFFSYNDCKKIGYIREKLKNSLLPEKDKNILISSLLYSADKCANTVGHYDAYRKGVSLQDKFYFDLIQPLPHNSSIEIYRTDANQLVKNLSADIFYIDPPYNSRQYSRFYHLLENLTTWRKPNLYGTALKPEPENISEYCKTKATATFEDLIKNIQAKYLVVSYNNTYNSKSGSSKNKILLEDLTKILSQKGELLQFEKKHNFFNAGKTDFDDHKEFIFIVKV